MILKFSREHPSTRLQTTFNIRRWFFPCQTGPIKGRMNTGNGKQPWQKGAGFLEVLFWEALLPFPKRRKEWKEDQFSQDAPRTHPGNRCRSKVKETASQRLRLSLIMCVQKSLAIFHSYQPPKRQRNRYRQSHFMDEEPETETFSHLWRLKMGYNWSGDLNSNISAI